MIFYQHNKSEGDVNMNITVVGRKCTPRDSFKERAEKKLAKVEKFFGDSASAKITATVEKSIQTVEVTVYNDGMIIRAQTKAQNMNDALDECVDIIVRQIRKNKTKLSKKLRSEALVNLAADDSVDEEKEFEVVRVKNIPVKPESVEEAILQMNLLSHQFYMFRNSATGNVAVVYKRNDGGYGIIEPDDIK